MDMGMKVEFLRPAMQDREHARRAADLFGLNATVVPRSAGEIDDGAGGRLDQCAIASIASWPVPGSAACCSKRRS
jgi:hypothetical protein